MTEKYKTNYRFSSKCCEAPAVTETCSVCGGGEREGADHCPNCKLMTYDQVSIGVIETEICSQCGVEAKFSMVIE